MKNVKAFLTTRTFKTTFSLLVNMVATGIVGLIFWRIASAVFPETSQIGIAGTLIAITNISSILAASGLSPAIMLMFSNKGNGRDFADHIIGFKTSASIVAGLMSLIISTTLMFIPNFEFLQNFTIILLLALLSGSVAGGLVLDYSMVATGQSRFVPYRNILVSILKTIILAGLVFVVSSAGEGVLLATLIAMLFGNSLYTFKGTGKSFTGWKETLTVLNTLRENMFSHQVSSLSASIPPVLAPIIITGVLSSSEAGLFTISWLLAGLLFYASTAVSNAFLTDAANLHYRIVKIKIRKAILFGSVIIILGLAGFSILGEYLLGFFGNAYVGSYVLLVLLSSAAVPDFFKNILIAYSRSRGFLHIPTTVNSISGVFNVLGLLILPPLFSLEVVGWVWLTVMSSAAVTVWLMIRIAERKTV